MQDEINNAHDIIDSRDVIARIGELDDIHDGMPEEWTDDLAAELEALRDLDRDGEDYSPDWPHGATLIRDSYFVDYAEQLAEDIGAVPSDTTWPCYHIDWEAAARDLKMDYTAIDFGGVTYWTR